MMEPISQEEWKKRMNGPGGGSSVPFPCFNCYIRCCSGFYHSGSFFNNPQYNALQKEEQDLIWNSAFFAHLRFTHDSRIGYKCETLNRWLFGLDDETFSILEACRQLGADC